MNMRRSLCNKNYLLFKRIVVAAAQSLCPTVCDPMGCSTLGSSVLHCLPKMAQIHVHYVSDAIISSSAALFFSLQTF